jgi:hypothetical protein
MKKLIIPLIIAAILLSGCTIVRIDTSSIDNITKILLSKENNLYNRVGKGYTYYVPRGVNYLDTTDLNDKLYCDGNYYYLYVDAVSYYYGIKQDFTSNDNAYYSKAITNGDKIGYLEINYDKKIDKYYIEFMYNYAKIEALVSKYDINKTVMNASYILSTVKFNNNVIKLAIDDNYFKSTEEKYDIFTIKKKTDDYQLQSEDSVDSTSSKGSE